MTTDSFNEMIADVKPTLVDFYATWCGPCKMQAPIIDEVKKAVGENANVIKIDIDQYPEIANRYNIRSIPTLIIYKRGEAIWRGYGVHTAEILTDKIAEYSGARQPHEA